MAIGAPDFNRLRMGNTYGATGGDGTGYRLYDTFLASVLPLIKSARSGNRAYGERLTRDERRYKTGEREAEQNFTLQRDNLERIGQMQMLRKKRDMEMEGGPNVFYDRFNEISAKDKAQLELASRGLDIREELGGEKAALDQEKLEEAKRKAGVAEGQKDRSLDIQDYKAKNRDKQLKLGDDGVLYAIGPTGAAEVVKDSKGNPVTQLSAREKLFLERDIALEKGSEESRLRQIVEEALIRSRGEETRKNIGAQGEETRKTQEARPSTPAQEAVAVVNRANDFVATNPDLAQWIEVDPDTKAVRITPPSNETTYFGRRKGPTPEEYQKIRDGIYGAKRTTPTTAKPTGKEIVLPSGKKVTREP